MGMILQSLGRTLTAGVIVLLVVLAGSGVLTGKWIQVDTAWLTFVTRWLHVLSGVMWIGLLWYFNFVQIPSMPRIPDEHKPAVSKFIAPSALFWFRWAAAATVVTGLSLAVLNGYWLDALALRAPWYPIGIGMWLALIMAFNVWVIIWPNQRRALGLVPAEPAIKTASARVAMQTSRINTLLSVPMLYCMLAQQHGGM